MPYDITLDRAKCIGCGTCIALCPGNFELRPDGKSLPKKKRVNDIGCNKEAERNCPVKCIKVRKVKK